MRGILNFIFYQPLRRNALYLYSFFRSPLRRNVVYLYALIPLIFVFALRIVAILSPVWMLLTMVIVGVLIALKVRSRRRKAS